MVGAYSGSGALSDDGADLMRPSQSIQLQEAVELLDKQSPSHHFCLT